MNFSRTVHRDFRFQLSQAFMILGLGALASSCALAYQGREPFATWLFTFAWWSYILLIDGWVYRRRKESLLLSYPGRFLFLCLWSVVLWLLFEVFNFRLENWHYLDLPSGRLARWLGYALAFATVVPGLFETADLVETAGLTGDRGGKPLGGNRRVPSLFTAAGVLMLTLPLLWPKFFFPLVWGGFIFLLEPLNERLGAASLLGDWRVGRFKRFWTLLLAGFLCGGLWEWWNAWARARWSYTVPWVGDWKIFEMPALGYLGFPPFAVEAFVMTATAVAVWERTPRWAKPLLFAAAAAFCLTMFHAVDRFTVRSFQP